MRKTFASWRIALNCMVCKREAWNYNSHFVSLEGKQPEGEASSWKSTTMRRQQKNMVDALI